MGVNISRLLARSLDAQQLMLLPRAATSVTQNVVLAHRLCPFASQMPRAVHVILCQLSFYVYRGMFCPMYKNGYVSVTVNHGIYAVGIRARFHWEGFMEEGVWGRVPKGG